MSLLPYLIRLVSEQSLAAADAKAAMGIILRGEATHAQIAAFLIALKMKGETVDELVGFARAMRQMAVPIDAGLATGQTLLDTCGTGGDGANTFNISTVAAFVVAGAGVHVAKHGNRSISSQCGSADLLEAWGIPLDLPHWLAIARFPASAAAPIYWKPGASRSICRPPPRGAPSARWALDFCLRRRCIPR